MDIKIFDNRILAPSKCGTRHLRKVFNDKRFDINTDSIDKISHIVIRNPYEHFESAIHTEYINYLNSSDDIGNVHHIIKSVTDINGIGHWNPNLYKFLYHIFLKNQNIKTIDLKNLSLFLESEGHLIPYNETEYNWSNFELWDSKDRIISKLKKEFINEFNIIETKLVNEMNYYNLLLEMKITKPSII